MTKYPTYDELPIDPSYPPHTAWGVFGKDDNLGTLNLLTEEIAAKAAQENVKRGAVFSLNWHLESPSPPLFNRTSIQHHIRDRGSSKKFDDVYDNFNTQSSTQFDGLRHVCHMSSGRFYNNVSADDIVGPNSTGRLGIHHMAQRGIAGRGVLLDYGRWCERNGKQVNPLSRHVITVNELEQVAKDQEVEFQKGDILLLRTGWMAAYEREGDRLSDIMDLAKPECIGVEACQDTYRWVWNNRFAAVAGDHVAFEAFPPKDWNDSCHAQFLGGFGMPIGEMFYLEKLAEDCAKDGRYTCLFTSAPLNKYQGVATPPNALCMK
ncbi:cyclase protein [Lichtheimia corymbifera JMRC:FSU:9682]|uniref:Cyclase protein n=1 Tax=Lichtheimia corymbifera JMRC:FSU:9682 TaxID=1263082 RepID=A0A068RUN4_9FUNG|nr:cyclase protein [Lichtheimia corymbifera JMRC:FSU:9682]